MTLWNLPFLKFCFVTFIGNSKSSMTKFVSSTFQKTISLKTIPWFITWLGKQGKNEVVSGENKYIKFKLENLKNRITILLKFYTISQIYLLPIYVCVCDYKRYKYMYTVVSWKHTVYILHYVCILLLNWCSPQVISSNIRLY